MLLSKASLKLHPWLWLNTSQHLLEQERGHSLQLSSYLIAQQLIGWIPIDTIGTTWISSLDFLWWLHGGDRLRWLLAFPRVTSSACMWGRARWQGCSWRQFVLELDSLLRRPCHNPFGIRRGPQFADMMGKLVVLPPVTPMFLVL